MSDFVTITCCRCEEKFGLARESYNHLKRSSQNFWCPNGHSQHFPLGPSEAETLRRERDRLAQRVAERDDDVRRQRERAERAERSASAYRGQATKLRRRAKAGVCPCCNRHFTQLASHMAAKHPDFAPEEPVTTEGA